MKNFIKILVALIMAIVVSSTQIAYFGYLFDVLNETIYSIFNHMSEPSIKNSLGISAGFSLIILSAYSFVLAFLWTMIIFNYFTKLHNSNTLNTSNTRFACIEFDSGNGCRISRIRYVFPLVISIFRNINVRIFLLSIFTAGIIPWILIIYALILSQLRLIAELIHQIKTGCYNPEYIPPSIILNESFLLTIYVASCIILLGIFKFCRNRLKDNNRG